MPKNSEPASLVTPDKRDSRTRILDAAAKAFIAHGYDNTRLAQIAKLAGVSRSRLYEMFTGKEQLLVAINHEVIAENLALLQRTLGAEQDASAAIRTWLHSAIALSDRNRTLLQILHSDEVQPNLLIDREATWRSLQEGQKWIRQILRRGIKAGEFHADIAVNRTALSLQHLHYLFTKQASADYPLFRLDPKDIEVSIELILRGLMVAPKHG